MEILGIMSDLSITLEALERARSQLSVSSYFDEDLFRREQELIFQHGPRYLAHELAIPEPASGVLAFSGAALAAGFRRFRRKSAVHRDRSKASI